MAVTPSTPAPRLTFTASLVVAEVVVVATNCLPRNCLAKRAVSFRESLEHIFIIHFLCLAFPPPFLYTLFAHIFFPIHNFHNTFTDSFQMYPLIVIKIFIIILSHYLSSLHTSKHSHTHTTRQCIEVLPQLRCSFTPSHFPTVFVCLCFRSFYRKELLC